MSYKKRGFGGSAPRPAPVEVGQEHEVDITEVSRRRPVVGVARIQGFVILIPGTKPGDHVKIKIKSVERSFATAEKIK